MAKGESAYNVLDLSQSPTPDPQFEAQFFRIARAGFSQKRKQLQKNLRQLGRSKAEIDTILTQANIDGARRAETLTLTEWRTLTEYFVMRNT